MEVISARAAFEAGQTRYFTGEPCAKGHIAPRLVCNGACSVCARNRTRAWKQRNKDKVAGYEKQRKRRNPEHVAALEKKNALSYRARHLEEIRRRDAEKQRRLRKVYPERERARHERAKAHRLAAQEKAAGRSRSGQCEICCSPEKIVFDHCHQAGHFRGWICDNCNKVLGLVKDNADTLQKMIEYLEKGDVKTDGFRSEGNAFQGFCGPREELPG